MSLLWFLPQHLVQWDAGNPECLLQLVKELIQQYHHYQCQRLRESSRLLFEYDSLLEDPNYGRNMEIYAGRKNSWVGHCFCDFVTFYIFEPRVLVLQNTSKEISPLKNIQSLFSCEVKKMQLPGRPGF